MRSPRVLIGLCCLLLALVAGCTGSKRSSTSASGGQRGLSQPAASGMAAAGAPGSSTVTTPGLSEPPPASGITATPAQQRDYVRTATMTVQVQDVNAAAADVLSLAATAGGTVDGDTRSGEGADRRASIIVRVPPARLSGLMVSVDELGHELDRTDNGSDVTATRADIDARTLALQTSIGRLTDLMKHSGSIADLVALENDLTQRESALESMQAQQRGLADQIALSTLTVQLTRTPPPPAPAAIHHHGPAGFGTALTRGLHALLFALRWVSALAGYLLPFLVLLGLAGIGAVAVQRRRPTRRVTPVEPEPVATP